MSNLCACGEVVYTRGLCRSCYGQCSSLVQRNAITWAELLELGITKEPKSRKPEMSTSAAYKLRIDRLALALTDRKRKETKP